MLSQARIPAPLRPRSVLRIAFASLAVVSIGLSGCSDSQTFDSKVVNPPGGNPAGEGSFKPNVTPTKAAAKAESY